MAPAQVPKVGVVRTKVLSDSKKSVALEELEHGGGLAAGHDEAVEAVEVGRGANQARGGAERGEGLAWAS